MGKKKKVPSRFDHWYPVGTMTELKPKENISQALMVFPGSVEDMLPPADSIPDEFHYHSNGAWNNFINTWIFNTSKLKDATFIPTGVASAEQAYKHISCILRSFQPKYEYKEAACAYLCSIWFKDVIGAQNQSLVFNNK